MIWIWSTISYTLIYLDNYSRNYFDDSNAPILKIWLQSRSLSPLYDDSDDDCTPYFEDAALWKDSTHYMHVIVTPDLARCTQQLHI